jgi:outer membrane protein insertion porin family
MTSLLRGLPAFAFTLLLSWLARGQTGLPDLPSARYVGKPIVDVQLLSEGKPTTDPAASRLVETRVGEPLAMAAVRESITHLLGLGRFQDVQVEGLDAPGGVALRYNLVPLHSVQRVDFRPASGAVGLGLSEALLRRTVENRFSTTPPVGRAVEVARTLEQLYRDHGYLRATVRPVATEKHDPDRTLLEFQIDPGAHAVIGTVQVEGLAPELRDEFLKQTHTVPSQPEEPTEITAALAEYVQKLRKRRHYLASASYRARPSPDGTVVDLTVDVQTGPLVNTAFRGDPLPQDRIAELVPIVREASVDEDLIEDSIQRIKSFLQQQGYWKAEATVERQETDGILTIVFTVTRGLQYRIAEGVELQGNRAIALELLRPALAKLGPNDVFSQSNLGASVSAIAGQYQRLGFAQVKVNAAVNDVTPPARTQGLVKPVIVITEGPRTLIGDVIFEGNQNVPAEQLRAMVTSTAGQPYYEPRVRADRNAVESEYRNRGFAAASIVVVPAISVEGTRADVKFQINEGTQTIVDHILIIGNTRTDERVIKRELLLQEGKPLGLEDMIESQRRLGSLSLFRRISIQPLSHGDAATADVLVTVEEASSTTSSYGGGLEVDRLLTATGPAGQAEQRLEFAPRGFVDVGRRNIGGKNRSVDLYTRLSLRPRRPTPDSPDSQGFGFSEYRIVGTYREPRAIGLNADLSMTAAVEQGVRSTFNFARKGVNAEVARRLAPGTRASGRYSFGTTRTFDEQLSPEDQARIDRIFPQVRLSAFAGAVSRDTRDDVLDPTRGTFLSGEASVAARALGGQVGFLKTYLQGYWFRHLPVKGRVIFASRIAVGLADGFPRVVQSNDAQGQPVTETVEDLPASERFFAGGDTTIRGFTLDTVGAPNTISATGFPRGGNAVLLMNGELRFPVWKDFGAVLFVDGGNVFDRTTEFDFGELRGSTGFGLRYRSPIGPVRLDVGFKMDRRAIAGTLESGHAFHFSIGQAF